MSRVVSLLPMATAGHGPARERLQRELNRKPHAASNIDMRSSGIMDAFALVTKPETVGMAGFEPATSSSRTRRAAKLRYIPATDRLHRR